MTLPYGLLGDPFAAGGTAAPPPFVKKPSIVDRVAARLFPGDQYAGLLDNGTGGIQREALTRLGLGLLSQSGPHPQGTGPNLGQAIAGAYQGVNFPEMANQALQLQQYRQQVADQQKIAGVAANHPAKPGETPDETYARIAGMVSDLAGQPGTEDLIGKLSNVLAQLRPRAAARTRYQFKTIHEGGQDWIYRINEDDPTDRLKIGLASPRPEPGAAAATGVVAQETKAAAQNALASLDDADRILAGDPNADIMPTSAAIAQGAGNIPIVGGVLKGAMGPLAQSQMSASQKAFQQAMDQFLHNYSALLPKGGRSATILANLRQSFTPSPGQTEPEVRAAFARARAHLRQTLQALAEGRAPDFTPDLTPPSAPKAPPVATPPPPGWSPKFLHPYRAPSPP